MRLLSTLLVSLMALPVLGQAPSIQYKIEFDPARDVSLLDQSATGASGLFVKVRFSISVEGVAPDDPKTQYKILIEENGRKVHEDDVPRPTPSDDLAVVLAIDTSGSMKEHGRMEKARNAAEFFLKRLPGRSDCGLILFDHEVRTELAPSTDRTQLLKAIADVQPRGGTAFLDAAARGIKMLSNSPSTKQRYLVLMTDGVDLNSKAPIADVVAAARRENVKILTIGIGEPGKQDPVSTVLVLDESSSMSFPSSVNDSTPRIRALHAAASRFVEIMPTTGVASILPFSTRPKRASEFTNDRAILTKRILALRANGETALIDATYDALLTLESSGRTGKRAVIAMTDGDDTNSRRRIEEVIQRAKDLKIAVHTLGFGREGEINEPLLRSLARETKGQYYRAFNEKALLEIFENLSIQLHDDGIDEISLKELAKQTGGQYFPVKDISELRLILEKVTETIQHKQYEVIFPSLTQKRDGTNRVINIKLVKRTGEQVSNTASGTIGDQVLESTTSTYQTRGLVVAEMHPLVYLLLLIGIGGLLFLPNYLRPSAATKRKPLR